MLSDNKTKKPRPRPTGKVNKATKKYVKKQIRSNTELKDIKGDIAEAQLNTLNSFSAYDNCLIPQGYANGQRIGNVVKATGFQCKGVFNNNGTNTNYVRAILVWSKKNDTGNNYLGTDLTFDTPSGAAGATGLNGLGTMYYPVLKGNYTVLFDKVYRLAPTGSTQGQSTRFFNIFKKLNTKITYTPGNGQTTSYNLPDKRLTMLFFASEGPNDVSTGQVVEISALTRMWYADA